MNIPQDLKYTKTHEWVKIEGKKAVVGITDYAQHEITDIVHIELPENGRSVKKAQPAVVLESVKYLSTCTKSSKSSSLKIERYPMEDIAKLSIPGKAKMQLIFGLFFIFRLYRNFSIIFIYSFNIQFIN